jgi:cell wall-associated NlpC family hydrolase
MMRLRSAYLHRVGVSRRLGVVAALAAAMLVAVPSQDAAASTTRPHDPIGAVGSGTAVTGGIKFTGWAADPDDLIANVTVVIIVDGRTRAGSVITSIERPTITETYGTGPTPGFTITIPLDTAPHTVCVVVSNIDRGLNTVLRCVPTPLGTTLTSSQIAAHNPVGSIAHAWAGSAALHFRGWSSDPDYVERRAIVVLYVDGYSAATVVTQFYPEPRPDAAGSHSAFDITVPVTTGMHIGCIWVVNVGIGSNAFLGCRARDTRGPAGTGTITVPTLNQKVVAEAKKHIGEPYVWGATGPDSFDCSGLVKYTYGKFGFTTPRVSEDQAVKARLIPASRAVPGDLVFTHDRIGDVYHVGIYVSPGLTIAAIDEAEGVDYQTIWDPKSATYGSFTHI